MGTELRARLATTDLRAIPAGSQGGPGTSLIRIRVTRALDASLAEFSSRDVAIIARLEPLLSLLNDLVGTAGEHPFQAIRLAVSHRPGPGGGSFDIGVTNIGTETVGVPELAALGASGTGYREPGLGVRVAAYPPEKPGFTAPPLRWSALRVAAGARDARTVSLPPGASLHAITRAVDRRRARGAALGAGHLYVSTTDRPSATVTS